MSQNDNLSCSSFCSSFHYYCQLHGVYGIWKMQEIHWWRCKSNWACRTFHYLLNFIGIQRCKHGELSFWIPWNCNNNCATLTLLLVLHFRHLMYLQDLIWRRKFLNSCIYGRDFLYAYQLHYGTDFSWC